MNLNLKDDDYVLVIRGSSKHGSICVKEIRHIDINERRHNTKYTIDDDILKMKCLLCENRDHDFCKHSQRSVRSISKAKSDKCEHFEHVKCLKCGENVTYETHNYRSCHMCTPCSLYSIADTTDITSFADPDKEKYLF